PMAWRKSSSSESDMSTCLILASRPSFKHFCACAHKIETPKATQACARSSDGRRHFLHRSQNGPALPVFATAAEAFVHFAAPLGVGGQGAFDFLVVPAPNAKGFPFQQDVVRTDQP